jgi:hypothetical protein
MSSLKKFFMLEDKSINNMVKQDRKENARLESYKIMGL